MRIPMNDDAAQSQQNATPQPQNPPQPQQQQQPNPQPERRRENSLLGSLISFVMFVVKLGLFLILICIALSFALRYFKKEEYLNQCQYKYCLLCPLVCTYFCPDPIQQKTQNGLILLGDEKDINIAIQYIKEQYLIFNYDDWRMDEDNQNKLKHFINNTINFRVVILISEEKLRDPKALYTRNTVQKLQHFQGIQNFLNYIDILIIERTFSVFVAQNLKSLAISRQEFKFKKTPHLIANLLFNLKNHSITQSRFFRDIQHKKGLNSQYLSLNESQLNIKNEMKKQAQKLLKQLNSKLEARAQKRPQNLMSLYYSVQNNQKDQILKILSKDLDERVFLHLADPDLEILYKNKVKKIIEGLNLNITLNSEKICVAPGFDRDKCEKQFYVTRKKSNFSQ